MKKCIICDRCNPECGFDKEHIYPQWILKKTNNYSNPTMVYYDGDIKKKITGNNQTVSICKDCNRKLGKIIEEPVSLIFNNIENGNGFNDYEAELLIRWLWKINFLLISPLFNENIKYSSEILKERLLNNIKIPRSRLSLAIAIIDDCFEDGCNFAPLGIDGMSIYINTFVAGVFSKLSIAVFPSAFTDYINTNIWTVYTLSDSPFVLNNNNRIYPKKTLATGKEAIVITRLYFGEQSPLYKDINKAGFELFKMKIKNKNKCSICYYY